MGEKHFALMKNAFGPLQQQRLQLHSSHGMPPPWGKKAFLDSCFTVIQREPSSTAKGRILDFHTTSPTKILHTTSSASQHGRTRAIFSTVNKIPLPGTQNLFSFLFFSTEAHYDRFFPPSIFLLFLLLVNTKPQVPGHFWQTLARSTLKFCLLLPKSFPHTDKLPRFFLTWEQCSLTCGLFTLKKKKKKKEKFKYILALY